MSENQVRVVLLGCGRMAKEHVQIMLQQQATTRIVVVSEPSDAAYQSLKAIYEGAGLPPPPNQPDLSALLREYAGQLDVAFIVTPHVYHFEQAKACLEAGLDVLLEKPMVVTAEQARELIALRDRTGRLMVIAFNGSLSAQVRHAAALLRSGELGKVLTISATVWEGWATKYAGHWKQNLPISGGGFFFDTGAHMMNTVADIAGEDFAQIGAWLDNLDSPVDVVGVVMGRLQSGALVTMNACGASQHSLGSDIKVFCTNGIIRLGVWGDFYELKRPGEAELSPVTLPATPGVWEQFLAVRGGQLANPSPPEIGLRMAKIWDAIQLSSAQRGAVVKL
jgi:predicted dehydrogenase